MARRDPFRDMLGLGILVDGLRMGVLEVTAGMLESVIEPTSVTDASEVLLAGRGMKLMVRERGSGLGVASGSSTLTSCSVGAVEECELLKAPETQVGGSRLSDPLAPAVLVKRVSVILGSRDC